MESKKAKLNFKDLEAERDKLYVSKNNHKRLKEIINRRMDFEVWVFK